MPRDNFTKEQRAEWREQRLAEEAKRPPIIPCRDVYAARWDPAKPLQYDYDPADYDPADYAAFKQARLDYLETHAPSPIIRAAAPDQTTRDRLRAGLDARIAEAKAKGLGPATFPDLEITSKVRGESVVLAVSNFIRIFWPFRRQS